MKIRIFFTLLLALLFYSSAEALRNIVVKISRNDEASWSSPARISLEKVPELSSYEGHCLLQNPEREAIAINVRGEGEGFSQMYLEGKLVQLNTTLLETGEQDLKFNIFLTTPKESRIRFSSLEENRRFTVKECYALPLTE